MTARDRTDASTAHVDEWRGEVVDEGGGSHDEGGGSVDALGRRGRIAAAAVGAVLVALGVRRRSLVGWLSALGGGWLVYRGLRGRNPVESLPVGGGSSAERGHELAAGSGDVETTQSVTIRRPAEAVYEAWRDPETLSTVFGEFVEMTAPTEESLRWRIEGPRGWTTTWDERIVEDRPGEFVRWESTTDAPVTTRGTARFRDAPGDRGTEVTLQISVEPPGGSIGDAAADRLDFLPKTVLDKALYRFKSYVETGEVPTLARNPSGRGQGDLL